MLDEGKYYAMTVLLHNFVPSGEREKEFISVCCTSFFLSGFIMVMPDNHVVVESKKRKMHGLQKFRMKKLLFPMLILK